MLTDGYILLHRCITEWEWYADQNAKAVFLHLLLTVNYYDRKWQGKVIKRGQRAVKLGDLADEVKLSVDQVRSALAKLERTAEITRSKIGKIGLITVVNYDRYQKESHDNPNVIPQKSHDSPNVIPTLSHEIKKDNKAKESNNAAATAHMREAEAPSDVVAVLREYESKFGNLPRAAVEEFEAELNGGAESSLIVKAIKETALAGAKSPLRYIRSILERCRAENIRTAEQFEGNARGAVPGRGAGRAAHSCAGYDLAEIEKRLASEE